jgi:hypothetical protein
MTLEERCRQQPDRVTDDAVSCELVRQTKLLLKK